MKSQHFLFVLLMLVGVGCSPTPKAEKQQNERAEHRNLADGIYYWKTTFALNEAEKTFLEEHQVKRLYLRFFDVVPADKANPSNYRIQYEAEPNATLAFRNPMPENVEVIPVVYITIDTLRLIIASKCDYAGLITNCLLNMADFHELGNIREVQLDCDWTQQTQDGYFAFCQAVRDKLEPHGIQLSCTIRLWQLACAR